jgi:RNA polymerase sigma factor (sigma-70 family)
VEASTVHAPQGLGRLTARGPLLRLRTDDQLVALFRMGHDEAFQVIFDRYRQRLFAYTRQMLAGSRSDAEDALQDVFLRAYSALRSDDRPVTLRAWLYRVAHNRCIDQLRRPTPAPDDVLAVSRTPLHDPLVEAERREDLRRLVADVRRLPDQQRSALLMRELDGLSYQELADALSVSVPAVKSLLVRARVGLVAAGEARDTACAEIRGDLRQAHDRGVRCDGRSRRHLRDCRPCREYQRLLRARPRGAGALLPAAGGSGPLGALAKLLGLGGAGSGAAAGATAGGGALAGGGVVAGGAATKVAAVLCCAAVVGGGAAEVGHELAPAKRHRAQAAAVRTPPPALGALASPLRALRPLPAAPAGPLRPLSVREAGHPAQATVIDEPVAQLADAPSETPPPAEPGTGEPAASPGAGTGGTVAPADDDASATPGDGAGATPPGEPGGATDPAAHPGDPVPSAGGSGSPGGGHAEPIAVAAGASGTGGG